MYCEQFTRNVNAFAGVRNEILLNKMITFQTIGPKKVPHTSEEDDFDLWDHNRGLGESREPRVCWKPSFIPISIICLLIVLVLLLPMSALRDRLLAKRNIRAEPNVCINSCKYVMINHSFPGFKFAHSHYPCLRVNGI